MTSSVRQTVPPAAPPARIALAIVLAAVVAAVVNTLIGLLIGVIEGTGYNPTTAIAYSVIGVLIGAAGWALVRRVAPRPAAVLRWLVPLVVVAELHPGPAAAPVRAVRAPGHRAHGHARRVRGGGRPGVPPGPAGLTGSPVDRADAPSA